MAEENRTVSREREGGGQGGGCHAGTNGDRKSQSNCGFNFRLQFRSREERKN